MFGPPGALEDAARAGDAFTLARTAGVVPRALDAVLRAVAGARGRGAAVRATLSFTYLELYQEKITDLLSGESVSL